MEIQYIRSCRNQATNGIRGKLRRFEFIEYFVRIGKSSFPAMAPSLSLLVYISLFMKPIADKSTFLHERALIKASMPLNKNLYENRGGLEFIYNKLKGDKEMLHKSAITAYIKGLCKSVPTFDNPVTLHAIFIYSLEIIVDEVKDRDKYFYLTFTEYVEYVCRIGLKLGKDVTGPKDKLEYKVNDFIKKMFEDEGIVDPLKAKLKSPEEDISF